MFGAVCYMAYPQCTQSGHYWTREGEDLTVDKLTDLFFLYFHLFLAGGNKMWSVHLEYDEDWLTVQSSQPAK